MKDIVYSIEMQGRKVTEQHDVARASHLYLQIMGLEADKAFPIFSVEVKALKDFAQERLEVLFGETIKEAV